MDKRSAHFVSEIYEDLRKGRINNILSKADLIQGTQIMTVKKKKKVTKVMDIFFKLSSFN